MSAPTFDEIFPDEVVTNALMRIVELPLGAGRLALITLDNGFDHTKPNTLGPRTLANLDAAITAAYAVPGVAAIGVTGKPFILAAGADLKGVARVTHRDQGLAIAREGHRVYARLADGPVPSFAFINGLALGGGFELGLNSTYRTASAANPGMGLPECFIGLVPGWGGAYLLPNLVGIDNAVKVIIENALNQARMLTPKDALALGTVDAVFDGADFLAQSLTWAAKVLRGDIEVNRREIDRSEAVWDAAIARGKAFADAKVRGLSPAPYRALELMAAARTTDRDTGFAAEDEALADLILSETTRANLYAFDLVQRRAKKPAGAPDRSLARPITKVGIVGAGLMASQLALLFVRNLQVPVVITDLDQGRIDNGVAYVRAEVDKLLAKGRLSPDAANRLKALISGSVDKSVFSDADFVIEAVFEELTIKKQVFAELEQVVKPECVLATNTSSLSVAAMAADLAHPDRVVGFHFFTPVAVMPLLEIAPTDATSEATLATAFAVGKGLKKSTVWSKDSTAFIVNRLLLRAMAVAISAVDEGTPFQVADEAMVKVGFPMGPFVLIAMTGPAVARHASSTLAEAFPDRFGTSPGFHALVDAGKRAIYTYDATGTPIVEPEVAALWPQGDHASTADEVTDRVLAAMAQEARLMIDEGVVQAPMDIDMSMLLGAGLSFANGGILPLLDRTGVSEAVTGQRFLPRGVASLPA